MIDLVALRALSTVLRLGSFERAARELHVTPSAVSQRVKALEERLVHVEQAQATDAHGDDIKALRDLIPANPDNEFRLTAAAGVTVTVNGANQYYTPKAVSVATTGETANVDNRFQNIAITVSSGTVKVGDAFTIASVNACHHITKADTGQLKTFRITGIVTGAGGTGTVQISPPIISAQGLTDAELAYQNVTATPANSAAITWLNTSAGYMNPFWQKDALELIPGHYAVPEDAGTAVMRASPIRASRS